MTTAPVYTYQRTPGVPPVSVSRLDRRALARAEPGHAHAHDFLVVAYFERGGGSLRIGARRLAVQDGDVFVIAPGEVVGVGDDLDALAEAEGWGVSFPPEGLGPQAPDALLGWRSHPLLLPFVRGVATGVHRLTVPVAERRAWGDRLRALDDELRDRREGYGEAVVAHLTLLLVGVARLATDVAGDLRLRDEPILAAVFDFIEAHYQESISLGDVAAAVSLTPGHLTTTVRRKTGRTVQDWIVERRMAQARRLLTGTDLTVAAVAAKVGYPDPGYFTRLFRRVHGTTPLKWRAAGR
jgi:AraC family transcriptional activator of pobA